MSTRTWALTEDLSTAVVIGAIALAMSMVVMLAVELRRCERLGVAMGVSGALAAIAIALAILRPVWVSHQGVRVGPRVVVLVDGSRRLMIPEGTHIILGVCAGILSGALGLGSGTIIVPALVLLFSFGQKSAQGMALAVMVPLALVGALRYWRNPEIPMNVSVIGLIVIGALAGTLVGTELAARLPGHVLRKAFSVVLVIVAVRMFVDPSKPKDSGLNSHSTNWETANPTHKGDMTYDAAGP